MIWVLERAARACYRVEMIRRSFHWPTMASVFAGLFGAGLIDAVRVILRGHEGRPAEVLALTLGVYGVGALVAALLLGWAAAVILTAWPKSDHDDERAAAALMAGSVGAVTLGVGVGAAQAMFVGAMASRTLATLAAAGTAMACVPVAALLGIACRGPALAVARRLPRLGAAGRAGMVLATLTLGALLAVVAALSRADWRVLDLAPLWPLTVALLLGAAHGRFWYRSRRGTQLARRLPLIVVRVGVPLLVLVLAAVGAGVAESSGTYQALDEHSWGMRLGLRVARRVTDGDGDGYSARFGGGDCDDQRADTFPGGTDVPGDGIDQNCEGGDATSTAEAPEDQAPPPEVVAPKAGAFGGNVLVLSVDALRADRLGVAGYGRPAGTSLTPTLDALARRGAYFRRAWSQAPNTPRSFPSFLTSRYPSEIAWAQKEANYSPLLDDNVTFFERLAAGGWKPIGIFSHFYFSPERNLGQGFAEWSNEGAGTIAESNKDVAAPRIVPKVIDRLRKAAAANERFVMWTHLFEPHSSYVAHAEFPTSLKGIAGLEEKYDYEIAFVDRWIGKIIGALEETGLDKTTTVVIVADHGEAWGEHKHHFHGQDTTEEQLRVPLIIAVPGSQPVVVNDPVALVDVGPTLLDLVGLPAPASFRGRSLLPAVQGQSLSPRPIFGELLPAKAWPRHEVMMVDGTTKLTHKITDRRWELHDLAQDPKQQRDLAREPSQRATLDKLRKRLLEFEEGRR